MDLLNHFNGISLAIIMVLSYCAVLKNTRRDQSFKGAMKSLLSFELKRRCEMDFGERTGLHLSSLSPAR